MAEPSTVAAGQEQEKREEKPAKKIAVLVVHGMGNQRPLETMRGVFKTVWLRGKDPGSPQGGRYWVHPDQITNEVDLAVLTTQKTDELGGRRVDFHELYWAHLISETKAVAVLLWLFELARRGPSAKWFALRYAWCLGGLFLAFALLSAIHLPLALLATAKLEVIGGWIGFATLATASLVALGTAWAADRSAAGRKTVRFVEPPAGASVWERLLARCAREPEGRHARFSRAAAILGGIAALHGLLYLLGEPRNLSWPLPLIVVVAIAIPLAFASMGPRGIDLIWRAVIISFALFAAVQVVELAARAAWGETLAPWLIKRSADDPWLYATAPWSTRNVGMIWVSVTILVLYLLANALFLQTVFGDTARYFRDSPANIEARRAIRKHAVDALAGIHATGDYDRVIVVAHSLGSVVAYDMLRAYWARVHKNIPVKGTIESAADAIEGALDADMRASWKARHLFEAEYRKARSCSEAVAHSLEVGLLETVEEDGVGTSRPASKAYLDQRRNALRKLQRNLQTAIAGWCRTEAKPAAEPKSAFADPEARPLWYVSDFVTLGSPLTHASYLMCSGQDCDELATSFGQRKDERELPTAPPRLDLDDMDRSRSLTFQPEGQPRRFHHSAVFGVTRWTNLYYSGMRYKSRQFPSVGDPIGGPLKEEFGWAIHDVDVAEPAMPGVQVRARKFFEHTSYWAGGPEDHDTLALIAAIDLPDALGRRAGL
jgi:hypothetical protein